MLKHSVMTGVLANADTKENVEKSFYAYNEASFTSVKSNGGVEYPPQTILIREKRNNGWWKIQTWEGEKWINLNGEKKYVEKSFYTYNEPSFVSPKGGGGQVFTAQEVPVIDGTTSGWLKIISYEGEKWINPNGEKKYVEKSFYTYNEPSFVSTKGNGGQAFSAQEVLVIDGTTSGWLKIISYEGEKWINPNGGIEMVFESTAYSVENSPPHERITAYGIDIGKNPNIKLIAVDPKVIPLGTQVDVEGYGVAIAGDTGGAIKGKIIDVLFPTEREAIKWGRKKVKIRILN
ncbi:3D domain-containing protein [Bacillus cereus group sp. BfR-BA-01495]|uniref:3D domain-containing protein n=1 Tax=Bacillus cereus group sp. BfR-BA-01495 TaxID=2920363 RepID=UPI00272A673E|nr:3D domain-containing protein [Bacillus cereus group sp. BfR-BA-01495]